MEGIKLINIGIRFLLELSILAILGYWGFRTGGQTLTKVLLAVRCCLLLCGESSWLLSQPCAYTNPGYSWWKLFSLVWQVGLYIAPAESILQSHL